MITWTNDNGTNWDVNGKIYNFSESNVLTTVKTDFMIHSVDAGYQFESSVTSLGDKYIVTWTDGNADASGNGIFGQIYDSTGAIVGTEFLINTTTASDQRFSNIATIGTDKFVVTWDDPTNKVLAQIYSYDDTNGLIPVGSEISVSSLGVQNYPSVASMSNGNFVIVWDDSVVTTDGLDGSGTGVFGQIFDSSGTKIGSEFQINSYISNEQHQSAVTGLGENFIVTWKSYGQDGDVDGVFGQIFDNLAMPISDEFQINTTVFSEQNNPSITSLGNDKFIVTWDSLGQDDIDGNYGVYTQLFYINKDSELVSGDLTFTDFDIAGTDAYLTHAPIGTMPFTQTLLDGTVISGDYQLEADNTAEFIVGWYDGVENISGSTYSMYKDLWYVGTTPVMANVDNTTIYKYKEFKTLNIYNYLGDFIDYTELLQGDGYIYYNPVTSSIMYISNQYYMTGINASFGYVLPDGKVYMSDKNIYLQSDGEGSLYGTNLQGLGIVRSCVEYKDYGKSTQDILSTQQSISTAFLESQSTITNSGSVTMQGYSNIIYSTSSTFTTADDMTLTINRDTGDIIGSINSLGTTNEPNNIIIGGTVAEGTSAYIMDDIFTSIITQVNYNDGSNDYSLIPKTAMLISIPDRVDVSDNFEMLDDESSWGYWTAAVSQDTDTDNQVYINPQSTWVAGVKTNAAIVTNLINGSAVNYTFNGHTIGAVIGSGVDPIVLDHNNYANFSFDFGGGNNNFSGTIGFSTMGGQVWNANIGTGTLSSTGFSANSLNISGSVNYNDIGNTVNALNGGSVEGSFFGTGDIKSVGGRFNLYDGTSSATGVFKAVKQP